VKILVDMNLAFRWADMLPARGISAVHWAAAGPANAPDTAIMTYAMANGYTILTNDLDFSAILAATHRDKPSVIQIRAADTRPEQLLESVYNALIRLNDEIEQGALVTIDIKKTRIHILPF
jgi:predicted nuclease of predicted toxin-antitoxin system